MAADIHHRYLNLCYGDPLFRSNPSLGASDSGSSRPGTKECRYLHFHVQPTRERNVAEPREKVQLSEAMRKRILSSDSSTAPANAQRPLRNDPADRTEDKEKDIIGVGSEGQRWRSEKQWVNCDLRTFDYSVLGQ